MVGCFEACTVFFGCEPSNSQGRTLGPQTQHFIQNDLAIAESDVLYRRDELEEIKTSTINETKTLQADTKAQQEADFTDFQAQDTSLREELARLQAELAQKKSECHPLPHSTYHLAFCSHSAKTARTVSYTHLTLPTIYSV